jgi:sigma-B regulation protein RsbU (phosphoserine phosphatase)
MSERLRIAATAGVCALFVAYAGVNAVESVRLLLGSGTPAWLSTYRGDVLRVSQVRPGSPAEGILLPRDELVAVDGRGVAAGFDVRTAVPGPPRPYLVVVRRDGHLLALTLATIPYGVSVSTFFVLAFPIVGALFLLTGSAVFALRPHDQRARLLAVSFALFASASQIPYPVERLPGWAIAVLAAGQAGSIFFWPTLLHLFLVFPEPSPLLKRLPRFIPSLYLLPVLLFPLVLCVDVLQVFDRALSLAIIAPGSPLAIVFIAATVLYATAALVSPVLTYRSSSVTSRRKLRVVVVGTLAGFLPSLLLILSSITFDLYALPLWLARALFFWAVLSLLLVPIAFAYAIVRHQVIPIRLLIRRGVRYLLVSRGFYLVEAAAVVAAIVFVLTGSRARALDRIGGRADILATGASAIVVFAALQLLNRRVMPAIDRRFLRQAYDSATIQEVIGEAARRLPSVDDLLALVAGQIEAALHPETLAVFLRDPATGHYSCAFPPPDGLAEISSEAPLIRHFRGAPEARQTEEGGLLLPIVAQAEVIGVLALGPRRGDLPYSREDRQLLQAVSWQLAFAIENTQLVRRKADEERMRREMAMASEVQRRLFPEGPLASSRLDITGLCLPAQGVGGDYYDFLYLRDGLIGIAVADVAGKGISAALLMSVVQASLRSQAGSASPTDLVASMNRLLYRSAARNRFASLFYAEFDEATDLLTFVNAGHNPPLLVRQGEALDATMAGPGGPRASGGGAAVAVAAAPATVRRLCTGGLVIGALAAVRYEEDVVQLAPGDLLVAYTDGVTEAFDAAGEEFGEDRLRVVVESAAGRSAAEVVQLIVEAVRAFSIDTPQHDDITLVVARVR